MKHEWMDDARCDADAAWVTEYGMFSPPAEVLARLQAVCLECPVIRECASFCRYVIRLLGSVTLRGIWLLCGCWNAG